MGGGAGYNRHVTTIPTKEQLQNRRCLEEDDLRPSTVLTAEEMDTRATSAPIPPATAAVAPAPAPLPFRTNRTNRMFSFADIDSKYRLVVSLVLGGATINDALEVAGIKRRTFRRSPSRRTWIEHSCWTNPQCLHGAMGDCELHSKTILNISTSRVKLEELFRAGACLKPLKK